jgi:hypothetical protein
VVTHLPNIGEALRGKFKDFPAETDSPRFHSHFVGSVEAGCAFGFSVSGWCCHLSVGLECPGKNTQSPAHGILL